MLVCGRFKDAEGKLRFTGAVPIEELFKALADKLACDKVFIVSELEGGAYSMQEAGTIILDILPPNTPPKPVTLPVSATNLEIVKFDTLMDDLKARLSEVEQSKREYEALIAQAKTAILTKDTPKKSKKVIKEPAKKSITLEQPEVAAPKPFVYGINNPASAEPTNVPAPTAGGKRIYRGQVVP